MTVLLGGVVLQGFEAPAGFRFGGDQRLAIHQLPGGARVIDAMGPDEADIRWRGFLSGNDAIARARQLDAMRQAGAEITLAWDAACYVVVLSSIRFIYHSAWWIQCDFSCSVVSNNSFGATAAVAGTVAQITADLASAGSWVTVGAATNAVSAPGATTAGTQANASAAVLLGGLRQQIDSGIASSDAAMSAQDIPSMAAAAGTLAGLVAARGYVGRAAINFANAGT
jgi:hypothetical protein